MVVYLDRLMVLDLLLDYLLLLLAGRLTGAVLRRRRLLGAAALGSLYSAAVFAPGLTFLTHPAIRLGVGILLVLLAYGRERRFFRLCVVYFALSAALGGALYALGAMGADVYGAVNALDLGRIFLFAALFYCLLALFGRKLARHGPREIKRVEVRLGGHSASFSALVDNGNTLSDPMTGKGVIVAEGRQLAGLLPPEVDLDHPCQCLPTLKDPRRFRLLPYRSVGVDHGLLLAVRADGVTVSGEELGPRLVALSPTPVSDGGGYSALIFEE